MDTTFLRRWQQHLEAKLLSEPLLNKVAIALMLNQVLLQPELRKVPHLAGRSLTVGNLTTVYVGSGILINLPICIPSEDRDVPGAQLDAVIYIDIFNSDDVALAGDTGSGLTAEAILTIVWMIVNQFLDKDIGSGNATVETVMPIEDSHGAYGYRLPVKLRMAQDEPAKCAAPLCAFVNNGNGTDTVTITCATPESLFLLLVLLYWRAIEQRSIGTLLVIGFLLPFVRPIGILCVLPLVYAVISRSTAARPARFRTVFRKLLTRQTNDKAQYVVPRPPVPVWLVLAPLAGWLCYLWLMKLWTGNALVAFHAERCWGVESVSNLFNIPKFITGFFTVDGWNPPIGSFQDRAVFIVMVYCIPLLWSFDRDLVVWVLAIGIIPAASGTFVSFTRFASVVFPIFISVAMFFKTGRRLWCAAIILLIFALIQAILAWQLVNFEWAG